MCRTRHSTNRPKRLNSCQRKFRNQMHCKNWPRSSPAEELTGNIDAKDKEKTSLSFAKPAPEIIREKQSESKKESLVGQDNVQGRIVCRLNRLRKPQKAPMPQPGASLVWLRMKPPAHLSHLRSTKNASPLCCKFKPVCSDESLDRDTSSGHSEEAVASKYRSRDAVCCGSTTWDPARS